MNVMVLGLPDLYWWLTAVTALICLLGFYKDVYFFNVAYPFSVVAMAVIIMVVYAVNLTPALVLHLVLLIAWGLRLGLFALRRERQPSYAVHQQQNPRSGMPLVVRLPVWLLTLVLYPMMVSPALFGSASDREVGVLGASDQWVGLAIMAAGLVLETWADQQKSAAKAKHPHTFASSGLFGWVRCPNYLGEMIFWLGNLIVGAPFIANAGQAVVAILGLAALLFIMLGATKRLEARQGRRYGCDPDYRSWVARVPILFPWTPVFSFRKLRVPEL